MPGSAEQRRKELAWQDGKAVGNRLYRGDDFVGLRRARQDSSRPCIERIEAVFLVGSVNEDYECRFGCAGFANRLTARAAAHPPRRRLPDFGQSVWR